MNLGGGMVMGSGGNWMEGAGPDKIKIYCMHILNSQRINDLKIKH